MHIHVDLDYSTRSAIMEMVKHAAVEATMAADRASRRATAVAIMQEIVRRDPSNSVDMAWSQALDILRKSEL